MKNKILPIILSLGYTGINNLTLAAGNNGIEKSYIDKQVFEENERKLILDSKSCLDHLIKNYLNIYKCGSNITFSVNPLGSYKIYNVEITVEDDENAPLAVIETLSSLILRYLSDNHFRVNLNKKNNGNYSIESPSKEVIKKWKEDGTYLSKLHEIEKESQEILREKIKLLTSDENHLIQEDENIMIENIKEDLDQLVSMLDFSLTDDNRLRVSYECMTCWRGICEYNREIDNIDDAELIIDELLNEILSYYYSYELHIDRGSKRKIICKNIIDDWKERGIYDSKIKGIFNELALRSKNKISNKLKKSK